MRLNSDTLFFDPYPLALIKGFAYSLAYLTAIFFSDVKGNEFYFSIIIFLLGYISEFFELGFFKEEKACSVKVISRIIFFIIILYVGVAFGIGFNYDKNSGNALISFLDRHLFVVKLLPGILCAWQMATGAYLMVVDVSADCNKCEGNRYTMKRKRKHSLGYRVRPYN